MDREELQERIRARRTTGEPYRRGAIDERGGYERFEPDPADARAKRSAQPNERRRDLFDDSSAAAAPAVAPDVTRERDDWARPAAAPTPAAAPPPGPIEAPPPSDVPVDDRQYAEPADDADDYAEPAYIDNYDDAAYEAGDYTNAYDEWEEARRRRGGGNALAILGFLALGVLALLGGAVLAGIFSGEPQVGSGLDSPSPSASEAATIAATPSASAAPSGQPSSSGAPAASGEPVVFPDGFRAEAQPCIPGSVTLTGCDSNAASNGGQVEVWIGFQNGSPDDVIGATLTLPDGSTADGSLELADINCSAPCTGYTYFPFSNLEPGEYEVQITRNGEFAAETSFEVT